MNLKKRNRDRGLWEISPGPFPSYTVVLDVLSQSTSEWAEAWVCSLLPKQPLERRWDPH